MQAAWRKHWRVVLAALAVNLVLLALLAWWWQGRDARPGGADRPGNEGPSRDASAVPVPASEAPPGAAKPVAAGAAASGAGPNTRPTPPVAGSSSEQLGHEKATVELCGVGRVVLKRSASGQKPAPDEGMPHLFQHALAAAWPQVLATLERSPDERGRAAALTLRAAGLPQTDTRDPRESVRQLALSAARSRDPEIYQWAWTLCARAPDTPECRALSAQGWLDRAPDDLRGWLLLAQASPSERERDSSLRRAAQAATVAPLPALTPWVDGAVAPGMPPYLRLELLVQAIGIEASFYDAAYFSALKHCREHPEARNTCSALADALAQRGTDAFSLGIARALGKHAGWTPERIAAVETLDQDLGRLALSEDPTQTYSCDSVERHISWFRDRATLGERAALRQRIAAGALSGPAAPVRSGAASR